MKKKVTDSDEELCLSALALIKFWFATALSWLITSGGGGTGPALLLYTDSLLHNTDPIMSARNSKFSWNWKLLAYFEYCRERVALYWNGISMSAARANAASFFDSSLLSDMIFVKFTNWTNTEKQIWSEVTNSTKHDQTSMSTAFIRQQNQPHILMNCRGLNQKQLQISVKIFFTKRKLTDFLDSQIFKER